MNNLAKHLFWLLLMQGISLVALGILVLLYPATLFFLVAFTFLWNGIMTLAIAWRVRNSRVVESEIREMIRAVA